MAACGLARIDKTGSAQSRKRGNPTFVRREVSLLSRKEKMETIQQFINNNILGNERLLVNLIAIHVVLGVVLIGSLLIRKFLLQGSRHLVRFTGKDWLGNFHQEAERSIRSLLFWMTVLTLFAVGAAGAGYHILAPEIFERISIAGIAK